MLSGVSIYLLEPTNKIMYYKLHITKENLKKQQKTLIKYVFL